MCSGSSVGREEGEELCTVKSQEQAANVNHTDDRKGGGYRLPIVV